MIRGFAYSAYKKSSAKLKKLITEEDQAVRNKLVNEVYKDLAAMYRILDYAENFIEVYDKLSERREQDRKAEES